MTRLNVGTAKLVSIEKVDGFDNRTGAPKLIDATVMHTYSVELILDDKGNVEGAVTVEAETDKTWQLIEASKLRK